MTQNDATQEFQRLLNTLSTGTSTRTGTATALTDVEFADLMSAAEAARNAKPWMWGKLFNTLKERGGFKKDQEVQEAVNRAKISAALGGMPQDEADFITKWIEANGYEITFSGLWLQHGTHCDDDNDYILRKLKLFASDTKVCKKEEVETAFGVWLNDARKRVRAQVFERIKYDPAVDPCQTELRKFVDLLIGGSDDPEELETIRQTAMIAFSTFLFRAKNHMRFRFFSSAHLMLVLSGVQGDGKTFALENLMSVLNGMSTSVSLEAFRDKSMSYQFSIMPVMVFEEMAGAAKADIDSIKAIMTDKEKLLVEKYKVAGVRKIISTFIGCSNKDIRNLLKDDTGNRRFIQFNTLPVDRKNLAGIDWLKIWQSVDENAVEPPMYASEENHAMIKAMQEDQRVMGEVETWINEGYNVPWGQVMSDRALYDLFRLWGQNGGLSTATLNFFEKRRFVNDLRELRLSGRYEIRESHKARAAHFAIQRPNDDAPTRGEKAEHARMAARVALKERVAKAQDEQTWQQVEQSTDGLVKRDRALDKIIRLRPGESPQGGTGEG